MVLDEPKEKDQAFDFDELKLIIDGELLSRLEEVKVDYSDSMWKSGFSVNAAKDVRALGAGQCC